MSPEETDRIHAIHSLRELLPYRLLFLYPHDIFLYTMRLVKVVPIRLHEPTMQAIDRVARLEGMDRSAVLRRIVTAGLDRYVGELYVRGRISLREAAELLGVPVRVALERLIEAGLPGNLQREDVVASLEALREQGERDRL